MNLRNRLLNNPCMLMMIGMTCFVISNPPSFIHVTTKMNPDALDFARGLMLVSRSALTCSRLGCTAATGAARGRRRLRRFRCDARAAVTAKRASPDALTRGAKPAPSKGCTEKGADHV